MKNVRYIAPIESMSGNLSGKQELLYPTKNNSAWESPSDKRNYATNYRPRYVGTYRAKNGKVSFQVKQRSAVTMTPAMRKQQAVLGGTKAIYDALIHNPLTLGRMQALYMESPERNNYGWSMYKWAYSQISGQVENKIAGIRIIGKLTGGQTPLVVQNPWISTIAPGTPVTVTVSDDILAKFWMQLANAPMQFTIDGKVGVAHVGDTWQLLVANTSSVVRRPNILNVQTTGNMVHLGNDIHERVCLGETPEEPANTIDSAADYIVVYTE